VLGTIAIFISLGGVSYGVATGTIDSREIKNSTIRGKDIRNSTVRGKDIRNSTITARDLRNGSVSSSDIKNNSLTGNDVLESSLGTVPSANTANAANTANFAGLSGATLGLLHTSPVTANAGDPDKDVFNPADEHGFRLLLRCTAGNAAIFLKNETAGNNAGADGDEASAEGDQPFDQGEEMPVNSSDGSPNIDEHGDFVAFGTKGAISGNIAVAAGQDAAGADCAANGHAVG
jgi:hypothetical protein